eukprot:CAMPEP_0197640738 /NCGR_PEP_ID=MMETSP1338-20131121/14919_1 /TAXON_ID=43686 ORGANISM="Pelagodinium beii, Strain RCC1491" /NCGR_SAMPLE_ID=MMETSP1338 /ASSEMBLY_ACC=CAM_ASM_000754 /LENGTH=668 /DNA_ID=CAMNT_0043213609 /DNA_START=16 /DNA_END=2018 /DNA_ORIENTATION=+
MNFPVPWRALLPIDVVPVLTSSNGLREICDMTGAGCEISGDGETPPTLNDKICTISGAIEQKEAACRRIVDKLRVLQEVADQEPGVFVIIVPSSAAPAVVGSKGSQIKEVIELSGAEISVGKENIIGMNDQPIGITGTGGQVVNAVTKINAILQDLADRGRLQPSDFRYRPGAVREEGGGSFGGGSFGSSGRAPAPTGGNPRTNLKFVVATQVAGWIIGKQGRHIRELQENSGSHIQVMKEGEVPPGVPPTDRIVEIGGRFDAKAEGIQIVLMAIDSMPALAAPRETLVLINKRLTTEDEIKDLRQMSGAEVEVRDLPGHDEGLCTLLGSIEARIKAAQQFLTRLEQVMADGSAPPPQPAARPAFSEPLPAPTQAPVRREEPPQPANDIWSSPAPKASTPLGQADPLQEDDPWSRSKQPSAPSVAREPPREVTPASKSVSFQREPEVTTFVTSKPAADAPPPSPQPSPQGGSLGGTTHSEAGLNGRGSSMSFSPKPPSGEVQMSFSPNGPPAPGLAPGPSSGTNGSMTFTPDGPSDRSLGGAFASTGSATSSASFSPGGFGQMGMGPMGMMGMGGMGGMGMDMMGGMGMGMGMGGMPGGNEAMFRSALQSSVMAGTSSQLTVLLSERLVQQALIPSGQLTEIANRCQIRIDLGNEVQPDLRQVTLVGG